MPIASNNGYIMFVKQTVKGTAVTPTIPVSFLDDGHAIGMTIENQRNGEDLAIDSIKTQHTETFGWSCYARPNISAYLLAYFLGADTVAGAGDPYTHTITYTDQGREWLTVERGLHSTLQQRMYDCKIEKISITGEAGKEVKFSVNGEALDVVLRTTALTPTYETRRPFMFYDGSGRFTYAGATVSTIKSFGIDLTIDSLGGLQNGEYEKIDLPDFSFSCDVRCEFYPDTFTNWKNVAYYGGTARSESIYTAALDIDLQYTEGAAARQLKFTIPSVQYKEITGNTLTAAGATFTESIAGVARKLATTELITITCKNNISTDLS